MAAAAIHRALAARAVASKKTWWENYVKAGHPFLGVAMGEVRKVVAEAWGARGDKLGVEGGKALAQELLRCEYTEDKLAGMLLLAEHLKSSVGPDDLPTFAALFDGGKLADWNSVDWFSVKVLGPIAGGNADFARGIAVGWRNAECMWRRRAACVSFVYVVGKPEVYPGLRADLLETAAVGLRCQERFAQTGPAWMLRELSVVDRAAVIAFVDEHRSNMTEEAVRSALKKVGTKRKR